MKKRITCMQWESELDDGGKLFVGKGMPRYDSIDLFDKGFIRHPESPNDFIRGVKMSLAGEEQFTIKLRGEEYSRTYPCSILGRQKGVWQSLLSILMNGGIFEGSDKQRERLNKALIHFFNDHCSTIMPEHFKTYKKESVGVFRFKFQIQKADVEPQYLRYIRKGKKFKDLSDEELRAQLEISVKKKKEDDFQEIFALALERELITKEEAERLGNEMYSHPNFRTSHQKH